MTGKFLIIAISAIGLFLGSNKANGQNIYNISVDSIKILKGPNGVNCNSTNNLVISWKITSSNSTSSYPFCQTGAILTVSTSGGSSFSATPGKYSGKLEWILYEGTYFGLQNTSIPLGSYRDTLRIIAPGNLGQVMSTTAQVSGTSGVKNPDCPPGTNTNSVVGNDDVKSTDDQVTSCTPLPIKLKYFKAVKAQNTAELSWSSESEINFSRFIVEHSIDGVEFNEISTQLGSGSLSDYNFIHTNPISGDNYYRLKMVDLDNTFSYSEIRILNFNDISSEIEVFPNPFYNSFYLEGKLQGRSYTILNTLGQVVKSGKLINNSEQIDLSRFQNGLYILAIDLGESHKSYKLLKTE